MQEKARSIDSLKAVFQKLLPLVDELADGLGILLLIAIAVSIWIFVYLFHLQQYSLPVSFSLSAVSMIPTIILARFWFALEALKDIPNVAEQLMADVTQEVAQNWHAVKSGKKGALNFLGQVRKLFEIRSLIRSADDIIEQYFSIGPLINPLFLFLAVLSFIGLFFLLIAGFVLGIMSLLF